ncbi:hypothetical protein L2E82_30421 [Cichorium intybus]|uniref:Uncharacterized protein n=1 Tax=Cichorium intybus TaxID=13427 RepID=A0ACB9D0I1_CICIN|nr:hypothetical protein L2E82_30421 [Cichorium intybus]
MLPGLNLIKKNPKHLEPSSSICSTSPITLSPVLLLCHHLYTAPFHSTLSTIGFHRSAYQSTPLSQQSVHATLSTTDLKNVPRHSLNNRFTDELPQTPNRFRFHRFVFRFRFRYSPPSPSSSDSVTRKMICPKDLQRNQFPPSPTASGAFANSIRN